MTDQQREARARTSPGPALFAVAAILVVLVATLTPGGATVEPFTSCVVCGSQGVADAISNIALFLPVGAAFVALGARPSRALLFAAALSAFVEGMQATVVGGRDPSLGDVVFNSVGGILGALAARSAHAWVTPDARAGRGFAGAAVFAACATVAVTGLLLQPALQRSEWHGQWTAQFGNMEFYRGRVLDAQLAGRVLPSWRLDDVDAARQALMDGQSLVVRVESSPLTHRISAIFSIYDNLRSEQFLLGANGTGLELYVRRRANDVRLINPPLRFAGALSGVSGGDTVTFNVHRAGVTWCAGRVPRVACLGYTAGAGWALLQDVGVLARHAPLLNALWLFGLLVPAGFWLRGRGAAAGGIAAVGLACAVVPMTCGLVVSPPLEWLGAACGVLSGCVLATVVRRRAHARAFQ